MCEREKNEHEEESFLCLNTIWCLRGKKYMKTKEVNKINN